MILPTDFRLWAPASQLQSVLDCLVGMGGIVVVFEVLVWLGKGIGLPMG